ncbi:hypothetical protein RUM43_000556 [Polyplax serrata]|uniref:Uncharacterized protein n=1 Tax=Polyplax serrata TaxID=468196 RepID=A0AAN8XNS4_POLSC
MMEKREREREREKRYTRERQKRQMIIRDEEEVEEEADSSRKIRFVWPVKRVCIKYCENHLNFVQARKKLLMAIPLTRLIHLGLEL